MTKQQQIKIINELVSDVKTRLLDDVMRIPENWDGLELREWVGQRFQNTRVMSHEGNKKLFAKRLKDFNNDCLVMNL